MPTWRMLVAVAVCAIGSSSHAQFTHWESPHGHPLDMTPDGQFLLAVNTHDARVEVYSLATGTPVHIGAVPVGLEPVSVRARTNTEAWVVNHISDSVSIVDLTGMQVIETIWTDDEPMDVVFAGAPVRAFVSVSQRNEIRVYDPASPMSSPAVIDIQGEDPRAMATDGANVFVAIFESGNETTIIDRDTVSSALNPYSGDQNPPPNNGGSFDPPKSPGLPVAPEVGLIVRKNHTVPNVGDWMDDNDHKWSHVVSWDLHDHDLAIIDASTLSVSYETRLMNANMALGVRSDGMVTVVGTDAINEVRYEPLLNGRFLRVNMAVVDPASLGSAGIADLNPHLTYAGATIPQVQRDLSIGDPRAIVWDDAGTTGYIAGMGSDNVIVIDSAGNRIDQIDVPAGPTGLVYDGDRDQLYVLSKFASSVSTIPTVSLAPGASGVFFDPAPHVVRLGRVQLYDTHETSGLGHVSCASCHIDARMDQIAWDLGDPSGEVKAFNQVCDLGPDECDDWHPMKGPMTTQTLIGILDSGPMHWRGDREDLAAFNPAYESINGDDGQRSAAEMQQFEDYIATIALPPNPNQLFDGSFANALANGGDATNGEMLFHNEPLFGGGGLTCVQCHEGASGTNEQVVAKQLLQGTQGIKVPQLRKVYEKTGFDLLSMNNNRGFGYTKDGTVDTVFDFLNLPRFIFAGGAAGLQQQLDIEAYLMSFPSGTHAAVGTQTTINTESPGVMQTDLITAMEALADSGVVGLIAKGRDGGDARGFAYVGSGVWQGDRAVDTRTSAQVLALGSGVVPMTYTVVLAGTQVRMGIDRDSDSYFDSDENDAGSDPADPNSIPAGACDGDVNGDAAVDVNDLSYVLFRLGQTGPDGDANNDGAVDVNDISYVLFRLGDAC